MVALFVLATIAVFLVADLVVIYARRRRPAADVSIPADLAGALAPHAMPGGMFLHPSHLWLTIDPVGRVKVGFDELAARLLGPLEVVRFPSIGRRVQRGETLFSVQLGDAELPIPSPITGTLEATQAPADVARAGGANPDAWLCTLQPEDLSAELHPLRIAGDAARWLSAEFARLRETLHGLQLQPVATMPDGGEPAEGLLRILSPTDREVLWKEFLGREG